MNKPGQLSYLKRQYALMRREQRREWAKPPNKNFLNQTLIEMCQTYAPELDEKTFDVTKISDSEDEE